MSRKIIKLLHKLNALQFGEFVLSSGQKSDYYVDVKCLSLHSNGLWHVVRQMESRLLRFLPYSIDAIGGMTLGADALVGGLLLHCREKRRSKDLRGFIMRRKEKDHGTGKLFEGSVDFTKNNVIAIIEDVTTTGQSALTVVQALREQGQFPVAVLSVVDRQEGAQDLLNQHEISLYSLVTADDIRNYQKNLAG